MAYSYYCKLSLLFIALTMAFTTLTGRTAEAQLSGPIGSLLGLFRIDGILFCSLDGTSNGTTTPIFHDAKVQLRCGGAVISTSVTNASGAFSFMLNPLQFLLSYVLDNCRLTVTTPLSTCNAALPSVGQLVSQLQSVGSTVVGLLNVTQLVPGGFRLLPPS
ncbi:phylloplanin-like [Punica granatum]|uniref:Uncharacterized protein n=2 Tax=Punica granatum TaxID=22663 RepID=A0A218WMJ8_PUNGR|nr:phylloplanin-like [Punica granatum]OWM74064.1 hypothetical protein CDL15_Pgr008375 [Punica granatum]PKI40034.1 hypothetical protein CRG98_039575 [Punica granatum]